MFPSTYRFRMIGLCMIAILIASGFAQASKWSKGSKIGRTTEKKETRAVRKEVRGQQAIQSAKLHKAEAIIGMEVRNGQAESLGLIKDLVTNQEHNRISYAVLEKSEALGLKTKLFAVPWPALRLSLDGKTQILDVPKSEFDKVEGFSQLQWPDRGSQEWAGRMTRSQFKQYSSQVSGPLAGAQPPAQFKLRRISELVGLAVKNKQGVSLGQIHSVIFAGDRNEGQLVYGIIDVGVPLGQGKKMAAVPWRALQIRPALDVARLDTDKTKIVKILFMPGDMPKLAQRNYAQKIHDNYNQTPYWEVFGFVVEPIDPFSAWQVGSAYNMGFDPAKITTATGTVQSVSTFQPQPGAAQGLRVKIKDDAGQIRTIYAGPKIFADKLGMNLLFGDSITVKGAKTLVGTRPVIMASQITKAGQTYKLRNKNGMPAWNTQQLRSSYQKPGK